MTIPRAKFDWLPVIAVPRLRLVVLCLLIAIATTACATTQEARANRDPLEPVNRVVFSFNNLLDTYIALPLAKVYVHVVPGFVRKGVHNVIANLDTPVTFANDVLQGSFSHAGRSLYRFGINSTLGLAGLMDVATRFGHPPLPPEDFGQTLAVHGVRGGPYLVLPLLGPSNPRDLAGSLVDVLFDPVAYYSRSHDDKDILVTKEAVSLLDERAQNISNLEQIKSTAVDYYATMRSLYRQHRQSEIHNGAVDLNALPEM